MNDQGYLTNLIATIKSNPGPGVDLNNLQVVGTEVQYKELRMNIAGNPSHEVVDILVLYFLSKVLLVYAGNSTTSVPVDTMNSLIDQKVRAYKRSAISSLLIN
jgi:hypothetical protein